MVVADAAIDLDATSFAISRIEAMIQGLEEDLATVTSTHSEVLQTLRGELNQFKKDVALQLPVRQPEGKKPAGGTAIAEEKDDQTSSGYKTEILTYWETTTRKSARNQGA